MKKTMFAVLFALVLSVVPATAGDGCCPPPPPPPPAGDGCCPPPPPPPPAI